MVANGALLVPVPVVSLPPADAGATNTPRPRSPTHGSSCGDFDGSHTNPSNPSKPSKPSNASYPSAASFAASPAASLPPSLPASPAAPAPATAAATLASDAHS